MLPLAKLRGRKALAWVMISVGIFFTSLQFTLLPRIEHWEESHITSRDALIGKKNQLTNRTKDVKNSKALLPVPDSHDNIASSAVIGKESRCALMFFGLPRSFKLLVLPSIVKNILTPNKEHRCDIFVHFYLVTTEKNSRSGGGGSIDPTEILLLKGAVDAVYAADDSSSTNTPLVSFTNDTDADFNRKRGAQLQKYRNEKGPDGNYLYYPWMAKSYTYPTTIDNLVKQWHSIQSVWEDMESMSSELQRRYSRVAMLRNDAVYVTPFDIYKRGVDTPLDTSNTDVIVPNWARFPINDRMIYGPHDAVRIWATERFERLETHVRTYELGYGMHSERFLNHSIFPAIREQGYGVVADPDICFFRTRVDGSTWINDCATRDGAASGFRGKKNPQALVEEIVGLPCRKSKFNKRIVQLHCLPETNANKTTS